MDEGILGAALGALLPITLVGCFYTVDLRDGIPSDSDTPGDAECAAGRRVDPSTGKCAACVVEPERDCPCGGARHAAEFPYCEGDSAYDCSTCTGGLAGCDGYEASDATARSCEMLYACCSGENRCCPDNFTLVCVPSSGGTFTNSVSCFDNACCEGECNDISQCDPSYQECIDGHCRPGCNVDRNCYPTQASCECLSAPT
jgi:hypothetical protein